MVYGTRNLWAKGVVSAALACVALAGPATVGAGGAARPVELARGSAENKFAEAGGPNSLAVSAFRHTAVKVGGHAHGTGDLLPGLPGGDFEVAGRITCLRVELQPDGTGTRASIKYRFNRSAGSTAPPVNGGVEVFIEDNGPPVNGEPVDGNGTGPPLAPAAFEAGD